MAQWYEVAFDRLYPVLYSHRNAGEAKRAATSFAAEFAGPGPVLDLACGGGRHMAAFAAEGVNVYGLDLSSFLLSRAVEEAGQRGRVVRGDMRMLPFCDGAFTGAINMFTSFGYFESDDENRAVLAEVARVLKPGASFLLDFANVPSVLEHPLMHTRREQDGYTIEESRRFDDGNRYIVKHVRVEKQGEVESVEYDERVRMFTPEELTAMLDAAGLMVEETCGGYDRVPYDGAGSDRFIALCRRP